MSLRYKVDRVDGAELKSLWSNSPHSTVFTHPETLSAVAYRVDWWCCYLGAEPLCMWPVALNSDLKVYQPPFTYWVGPIWSVSSIEIPVYRRLQIEMQVYTKLIERLLDEYGEIRASIMPKITDVRVFDWWNYHERESKRFQISPRYTAILPDLHRISHIEKYFRGDRRRQIKSVQLMQDIYLVNECENIELSGLYESTLNSQQIVVDLETHNAIATYNNLVKQGFGTFIGFRDRETGTLVSAALLLISKKTGNLVLRLVDPSLRKRGIMAWTTLAAIQRIKDLGCETFDFNGANSPRRGDDKHSYGAKPILFFEINY